MPTVTLTTSGVFGGYTLEDLRAETLRALRVTDTTRFSPAKTSTDYTWIDRAINRGQEDFVRQTRCLKGYSIMKLKSTRRLYRLPEELIDLDAVYYYDSTLTDGYSGLNLYSIAQMNDEISGWRTDTGTPERCYIDRDYGAVKLLGVHPVPTKDGDVITPDTDYGVLVEWICPLYAFNQDYGVIINVDSADEYILATQSGVAVEVEVSDGNLYIEYSRLPQIITAQGSDATQYTELPREYQQSLWMYAAASLLQNNPEDSAEYKRAGGFLQMFQREVDTYKQKRRRAPTAMKLRTRADQWNYVTAMPWYESIP